MPQHLMLSEKQRVWLKRHLKPGAIVGATASVFAIGLLTVAIRADNWANWTGLGKGESTSVSTVLKRDADGRPVETETTTIQPGKTLWDWLGLLGVPLTLAILGYVLQQQERNRAETLSREQREIAANEAKEEALQIYFDRLSTLLIDKNILAIAAKVYSPSGKLGYVLPGKTITLEEKELLDSAIDVIRARTLSILRRFEDDTKRKSRVIGFLLEAEIIVKAKLKLSKANLSGVRLSKANLRGANLRFTNLSKANLSGGNLNGADLSRANLGKTNLQAARLSGANLDGADLRGADLCGAYLNETNLSNIQWDDATQWPSVDEVANANNIPEALKQQLGITDITEAETPNP